MSALEEAADRLEARKAAAFGVRDLDEIEGACGGENVTRMVCGGFDIDLDELTDYSAHCVRYFAGAASRGELGVIDAESFMRTVWLEGFVLGLQVQRGS